MLGELGLFLFGGFILLRTLRVERDLPCHELQFGLIGLLDRGLGVDRLLALGDLEGRGLLIEDRLDALQLGFFGLDLGLDFRGLTGQPVLDAVVGSDRVKLREVFCGGQRLAVQAHHILGDGLPCSGNGNGAVDGFVRALGGVLNGLQLAGDIGDRILSAAANLDVEALFEFVFDLVVGPVELCHPPQSGSDTGKIILIDQGDLEAAEAGELAL